MKRLHISMNVTNLEQSVGFYSTLFGSSPTLLKSDYAQWMLDDPRVNFVLEQSNAAGFGHAGIQTESEDELQSVFDRLIEAEAPYLPEGTTNCCYHKSEKSWTMDPDGTPWEAFYTLHETTDRGVSNLSAEQLACCAAEATEAANTEASDCCAAEATSTTATSCCEGSTTESAEAETSGCCAQVRSCC